MASTPNSTIIDPDYCNLSNCTLAYAQVDYIPTKGGNLLYLIIFAALILPQVALGIRFKTWGYMISMICGLILEVVGYVSRLQLHDNPFDGNAFKM